jgi:chromodomain-helicase-DNA-binding protein 7
LLVDLTDADTVNIHDSDWNPQNDIQAQSRCYRFGQTKDLKVYRLITRDTSEGKMFQYVSKKLGIDFTVFDANSGDLDREDEKET